MIFRGAGSKFIPNLKKYCYANEWKIAKIAVWNSNKERILSRFHEDKTAEHMVTMISVNRISESYCWPGIECIIRQLVAECQTCTAIKSANTFWKQPMAVKSKYV